MHLSQLRKRCENETWAHINTDGAPTFTCSQSTSRVGFATICYSSTNGFVTRSVLVFSLKEHVRTSCSHSDNQIMGTCLQGTLGNLHPCFLNSLKKLPSDLFSFFYLSWPHPLRCHHFLHVLSFSCPGLSTQFPFHCRDPPPSLSLSLSPLASYKQAFLLQATSFTSACFCSPAST